MEGVVFYDFPALSGETIGITHGASLVQDVKALEAVSAQPHEAVRKMYPQILLGEAGRAAYRGLLDVLLESDGGAVLWHCTEGKDRAGLGAVVVERALGVSEADVRADYLATNLFARSRAEGVLDALAAKLPALRGIDADVDAFFYAYADYYDAAMGAVTDAFGTFDAYLTEALDFGPEKQAALREKYLA
jgi:protein-tyrosine phosphatase